MAEDAGGQPFRGRREWSLEDQQERHARANRNRLTPIVPGAFEGEGRLCTPVQVCHLVPALRVVVALGSSKQPARLSTAIGIS